MQVSESTCNWRPCSAARAISFPPRCCLAYQPFGASLVQGKHNQKIPMTHFTPGSMVKYHCYDAWNGSADFQGCTTSQMWWLSCTLSLQHLVFTNSKKSGAVGNGNGDLSVTFCHTCCSEAGTNNDSLIFSIPQAGATSSRPVSPRSPIDIRWTSDRHPKINRITKNASMFLMFSPKKIWYLILSGGLSKPRKIAANCQG